MNYSVRCATSSDSAALRQLLQDLSRHLPVIDVLLRPDVEVKDLHQRRMLCFMAFETSSGLPVGLCLASRNYFATSGHMLTISGLYVDPRHRRQGLCGAMLHALLSDGSTENVTKLDMDIPELQKEAQTAVEALGFQNLTSSTSLVNCSLSPSAYQQLISKPPRAGVTMSCLTPCAEPGAFNLRLTTAADIEYVFHSIKELEEMHDNVVTTDCDILTRDMQAGLFTCIVVEDTAKSRTVGLCLMAPVFSIIHGLSGRIIDIVLDPTYRGKGLGGALMQACCQVAQSQGIEFLDLQAGLWNTSAMKMYEHLGFAKDEIITYAVELEPLSQLRRREVKPHISLD